MKRLLKCIIASVLLLSLISLASGQQLQAQEATPATSAELFEAMKLTESQHAEFKATEQSRRKMVADTKGLTGEVLKQAKNAFYAKREAALKKIFTDEQWSLWTAYWNRSRNVAPPEPKSQPAGAPAPVAAVDLSAIPAIDSVEVDRFGGWKAKSFDSTGFFRTHHDGSRWWLVTPEGHPFISFGLNHFSPSHWNAPYNREHWVEQFGAQKPMDPKWKDGFRTEALNLCRKLGITALGVHNDATHLTNPPQGAILPYIRRYQPVVLSHYTYPKAANYHDVFAPQFVAHCDMVAKQQALPYKDDPMLIGYSMADAPLLTDAAVRHRPEGATTWPRVLRNLGSEAPGKQTYVGMLRERHKDITALNDAYGTSFDSWESLAESENWRPQTDYNNTIELEDNSAFLCLCIDQYYTVAKASLRKVDPNHMFLGDKLGARGDTFDAVIEVAAPHIDVINYGHYGRLAEQAAVLDRWTGKLKKPFLSADGSFSVRSEMLPNPMGPSAENWGQCSEWTRELASGLFARPDVVGWNICGVIEVWKTVPGREKKQHQGIMDPFGKINPGMEAALRDVSSRLYHIADSQDARAKNDRTALRKGGQATDIIGRKGFIHVERIDGVWFMVDATGKRFIPTGMNHISPTSRFAPYNRAHWLKQFGEGLFIKPGQINWQGPEVKKWMEQIAKDHKDYNFTTIAFHYPPMMPAEYFETIGMNYIAKLKLGVINDAYANRSGGFPDVFDPSWRTKADEQARRFCNKHKNNKHLLGYSFNDMPDYDTRDLKGARLARSQGRFIRHPWVNTIISKPGLTAGKKVWKSILQTHYKNPTEAGEVYGVELKSWEDVAAITQWGIPSNVASGEQDQDEMSKRITEVWLKINFDLVRKYDPDHLILGDKIGFHFGQPDWVLKLVSKYVDVLMIQHYDYFTPHHERSLKQIYEATGKPILNGDHAYGVIRPKMQSVKGRPVKDLDAMGKEYATYLRGIMNLPFMVGWLNCGYMETWDGAGKDGTGKCQCGLFDPFGRPLTEALNQVKEANAHAVKWHERAGALDQVYSRQGRH
jgi:hypothetical protein